MTSNSQLREDEAPHEGMRAVLRELAQQLAVARDRYDELVEWRSAKAAISELGSDQRLSLWVPKTRSRPGIRAEQRKRRKPM
jgi:hypothetical protein